MKQVRIAMRRTNGIEPLKVLSWAGEADAVVGNVAESDGYRWQIVEVYPDQTRESETDD
jgi:hypothetical protein